MTGNHTIKAWAECGPKGFLSQTLWNADTKGVYLLLVCVSAPPATSVATVL